MQITEKNINKFHAFELSNNQQPRNSFENFENFEIYRPNVKANILSAMNQIIQS